MEHSILSVLYKYQQTKQIWVILYLSLHVGSTVGPQAMYTLLFGHLSAAIWRYICINIDQNFMQDV